MYSADTSVIFDEALDSPKEIKLITLKIGGLLSLFVFIIAIAFYINKRKNNLKIKGIIINILTSIIALPTLFFACCKDIRNIAIVLRSSI